MSFKHFQGHFLCVNFKPPSSHRHFYKYLNWAKLHLKTNARVRYTAFLCSAVDMCVAMQVGARWTATILCLYQALYWSYGIRAVRASALK